MFYTELVGENLCVNNNRHRRVNKHSVYEIIILISRTMEFSNMGQLENMQLFIKVAELGSITKTANTLNIAKSAVSRRLSELEASLGVTLIQRTTRRSHLTEAGSTYLSRCLYLIDEIKELNNQLTTEKQKLTGTLKVAVPLSFGMMHLIPAMDEFLQEHSQLKLDIHFSDRKVDIIEEGFDLAFRIGKLQDSSFKARKITEITHVIIASPDYLNKFGKPETIDELKKHKLLKYSDIPSAGFVLTDTNGQRHNINMETHYSANNGDFLKFMSTAGHGITMIPRFIAWQEIKSGKLVPLLTDYQLAPMQAYALFPNSQYLPQKVRKLIDFLVEKFGDTPYWNS